MVDLKTVFGVCGLMTTVGLYLSAVPSSLKARRTGVMPFDPTPSVVALINCFMWIVYATMIGDLMIFGGSAVGIGSNSFVTFIAIRSSRDEKLAGRLEIIFTVGLVVVAISVMGLISPAFIPDLALRTHIASNMCLTVCLAMFLAPLLQAAEAVRARDASQINGTLTMMQLLNGCLWSTYGMIMGDRTVFIPNGASVVLGVVNLIVKIALLRFSASDASALQTPILDVAPAAGDIPADDNNSSLIAEESGATNFVQLAEHKRDYIRPWGLPLGPGLT